jgi:hypothetical protein
MAYTRGTSSDIIVGAAALFTADSTLTPGTVPAFVTTQSYKETLSNSANIAGGIENVGYTSNGIEITFQPDFGEVQVDQILDVAKLYKQGMQVTLATSFAEATLENLLFSIAGQGDDLSGTKSTSAGRVLNLASGDIGECPVERALIAVGPGTGDCEDSDVIERVYVAYRALSIENVTVSAKRDTATMFDVTFRLLPEDTSGSYGKIIDRTIQGS